MDEVIRIEGLVKVFGRTRALDGLDLAVRTGQVHGFLGPNGAGKSTTLRTLLGLLRADAGRVELLGGDPWSEATRLHRRLAYVPSDVGLWPSLTGGEVIDLLGRMQGRADHRRRDALIERFGLDPTKRCRSYSTGNRQKVALIAALAAEVELLILDEPTSGLDPLMEAEFQSCVREAAAAGRTVLLSSHILGEVEALCDQVSIVRDGRTVESAPLDRLRHLTRSAVSAEVAGDPRSLAELPGVDDVVVDGSSIRCQIEADHVDAFLAQLAVLGTQRLTITPPTLEEIFLGHYRPDEPPDRSQPRVAGR